MDRKTLYKVTRVVAKIGEIGHWIAAVAALVGLVLTLVLGAGAVSAGLAEAGRELNVYGFEVTAVTAQGEPDMPALRLVLVAGAMLYALMAMVFRNVYLILKSTENGASPFLPDNVRMVREIGIFFLAQPVVGLLASWIGRLILGPEAEISVSLVGIVTGLVLLCLSQAFARGQALESDVDGLL